MFTFRRGSVLLQTLVMCIVLSFIAVSITRWALSRYTGSNRTYLDSMMTEGTNKSISHAFSKAAAYDASLVYAPIVSIGAADHCPFFLSAGAPIGSNVILGYSGVEEGGVTHEITDCKNFFVPTGSGSFGRDIVSSYTTEVNVP